MSGLIDLPAFVKCEVNGKYLYGPENNSRKVWVEAYAFAVTALRNRPLLFTVHTVHGAVFSRIPIEALRWRKCPNWLDELRDHMLQPWSCLGERIVAIQHQYLKDYELHYIKPAVDGRYLFTLDFLPDGHFTEDPEQHKTMSFIALETGQFALLPNNMFLARDRHFTENDKPAPPYKRNKEYFWANG